MTCRGCHSEVKADHHFCSFCGTALKDSRAALRMAPFRLRAMVFFLDIWTALGLTLSLGKLLPDSVLLFVILGVPWLYFIMFQSGGRRTFGQTVFGTASLRSDGESLTIREAAQRALLQVLYWCLLLPPLLGPRFDWLVKRGQGEYLR
jgi:uncharacterized RDD family membrane protein YckC